MTTRFDADADLIVINAGITGPVGRVWGRFALDPGATSSVVRSEILEVLGYDLAQSMGTVEMVTGSSVVEVDQFSIMKIEALENEKVEVSVLVHDLPKRIGLDGLIGLDFIRGKKLTIDFRSSLLLLE